MSASAYTQTNILNASLRGVAYPLPAGTWVSLHTADPTVAGLNEVSTVDWPAYVRRKAEGSGAIGTGWTVPAAGVSNNTNQIVYPGNDGVANVVVTHFAIWDAATGGNCIGFAPLDTTRTLQPADILVFDINALTATVS